MNPYVPILITLALVGVVVGGMLLLGMMLGPKNITPVKEEPFECGEEPFHLPGGRFSIKFYMVAIMFILFDIELMFLYPWAVEFKSLGASAFWEMFLFLGVLIGGFVYVWKKGAFDWE
jgi:NADH-quinone oxidoreductase subunit A